MSNGEICSVQIDMDIKGNFYIAPVEDNEGSSPMETKWDCSLTNVESSSFRLMKMQDPRTDVNVLAQYNPNLVAYVGARNWNKFMCKQDYTSSTQLKFSDIKIPGNKFLIDMKWWFDYKVTITFNDFPYPVDKTTGRIDNKGFIGEENIMQLRPYLLHQCAENIHMRINNRDTTSYPMQTLNQRMEYWRQEKMMDSGGVCPHRKPSTQSTYGTTINGRSTFMNIGSTYDGDMENEVVLGDITVNGFAGAENLNPAIINMIIVVNKIGINLGNSVMGQ